MTTPIQLYNTSTNNNNNNNTNNHAYQPSSYPVSPPTTPKEEELTTSARLLMHHTPHPEFNKKYILGQELGSGGFGFVVSAYERQTGIERAVKFIIRNKVPCNSWVRDPEMGPIPMEIYTLKHVRHPNIISYFDAYQDNTFFYLVMELHGTQWSQPTSTTAATTTTTSSVASVAQHYNNSSIHSPALSHTSDSTIDEEEHEAVDRRQFVRRTSCDLFECIEQHRHFEEALAKKIFRQIVDCVAYLDSVGICHRDIKDENIVIDHEYKVKLIDFGSAVSLSHPGKLFTRFYGTISFASPEILLSRPYRAEPAEVWSLGILLFTLLFGEIPFLDSKMAVMGRTVQPKVKVSHQCKHLISSLLELNPDHRPTIQQVLTHPWLRDNY